MGNTATISNSPSTNKTQTAQTTPKISLETIINRLDTLYRSDTAYAEMEMTIQTPHWKRTLTMKTWSKGLDKTFIVIESPPREKGISTLRKGNEMWNFFPKINKTMKIPPSMMMGSWMGSDFTNDDLVKESTRMANYYAKLIQGENRDNYYIEFVPHKETVSLWGKIVSEIDKKSLLPVSEIFYDEKNQKIRELYFKKVTTFGNKTIPAVMELIPTTKKNHKTIIHYTSAKFDEPIDKKTFTLRNLKKKRR
ncbi:outer membrane lipoprotein-sorting protein [Desulfocicer vacuolatum]|nr:outer membrane lipoprotein-sorting protein [Desulfocicer vacuolatum]